MLSRHYLCGRRCVRDLVQVLDQVDWRAAARAPVSLDRRVVGLLLAWTVLRGERTWVLRCLEEMGTDMWGLTRDLDNLINQEKQRGGDAAVETSQSFPAAFEHTLDGLVCEWLDRGVVQSLALGHHHVGVEHLLLALTAGEPSLAALLAKHGIEYPRLRQALLSALAQQGPIEVTEVFAPPQRTRPFGAGWDSSSATGVPRRFSLAMLLMVTTLYAILFGTMRALGTPTELFVLLSVFFTVVALGQPILYGGRYPRAASLWIGAVLLPSEVVGLWLYAHATGFPYVPPFRGLACGLLFCLPLGAALGYLSGALAAGIFVLADEYEKRFKRRKTGEAADEPEGDPFGQPVPQSATKEEPQAGEG